MTKSSVDWKLDPYNSVSAITITNKKVKFVLF